MGEDAGRGFGPHKKAYPAEKWCKQDNDALYISVKALSIAWGNDKRYWRLTDVPEGIENDQSAELLQVNWLDVSCKLDCSKINYFNQPEPKTYEIFWVIKFNVDSFGWHKAPVKFTVVSEGKKWQKAKKLEQFRKDDRLVEIPGGEFTVAPGKNTSVSFGLSETKTNWWKGNIVIAGAKIKPKNE
ncbi:uncharacterized protein PHLOEM PROTEIN 2-LIKE A4-like [Aristolochia californica]|uniref:uncharacterized protein PHLOEM PROTEIN 2-LIKE A4-like n=1 Tax=Aristolochia californica TaxID=171875 RepID=UPI0035DF6380